MTTLWRRPTRRPRLSFGNLCVMYSRHLVSLPICHVAALGVNRGRSYITVVCQQNCVVRGHPPFSPPRSSMFQLPHSKHVSMAKEQRRGTSLQRMWTLLQATRGSFAYVHLDGHMDQWTDRRMEGRIEGCIKASTLAVSGGFRNFSWGGPNPAILLDDQKAG